MNSGNRLKSWTMIQSLDPSCFCFSQCRLNTGDIKKCKYANFTSDSVGFSFRLLCSLPKIRSTFKNCKHGKGNTLFKYFEGKNLKKKKKKKERPGCSGNEEQCSLWLVEDLEVCRNPVGQFIASKIFLGWTTSAKTIDTGETEMPLLWTRSFLSFRVKSTLSGKVIKVSIKAVDIVFWSLKQNWDSMISIFFFSPAQLGMKCSLKPISILAPEPPDFWCKQLAFTQTPRSII